MTSSNEFRGGDASSLSGFRPPDQPKAHVFVTLQKTQIWRVVIKIQLSVRKFWQYSLHSVLESSEYQFGRPK